MQNAFSLSFAVGESFNRATHESSLAISYAVRGAASFALYFPPLCVCVRVC